MTLIGINAVEINTPSTLNPIIMDICNAERSANGMMIISKRVFKK